MRTEAERRVRTRLGELRVRVVDPPGGAGERTAVLWPSMFVDSTTFDGMLPLLPPTHRLVLVDGPGLGGSEPLRRRSSVAEAALAAVDLLEGLGITEPVDWVGNALGGHVGYELGLLSSAPGGGPLRSLVAVSAPLEPVPPLLRVKINVLRPLLAARGPVGPVRSAVVDALLTDASAADPDVLAVLDASLRRPTPASLSTALASFVLARVDVRGHLPRLHLPCLFVALPADRPVLVEGFRLLPALVAPLLAEPSHALWLLPTPAFRRRAFAERGSLDDVAGRTSDPPRALANLLERDALFTDRLRAQCADLRLPVLEVDGAAPLQVLADRVGAALWTAGAPGSSVRAWWSRRQC